MMFDDAVKTVQSFLDLLSARKLDAAQDYLLEGAVMTFPGDNTFTSLAAFAEGAGNRYQSIGKRIDGFDTVECQDSSTIVYCYGTLHGRWIDGEAFSGIRFIDRFVINTGKIMRQDVWNDLSETRSN
jgi:hypothetical protein